MIWPPVTALAQKLGSPSLPWPHARAFVRRLRLFRDQGYDSIAHKSVFDSDYCNITLFDPADADLTNRQIFEAESLEFQIEEYGVSHSCWIDETGIRKSMRFEVTGPAPSSNDASSGAN